MNKLMSIFGAIIFASFIMTSCGGASTEATPEASGDAAAATAEAMAPEATAEAMAPEATASEATVEASAEAKAK